MNCYVIYDKLAKESGDIFLAINDEVALRKVNNEFKAIDAKQGFITDRSDQLTYRIGYYDPETMLLTGEVDGPWEVIDGLSIEKERKNA